MTRYTFGAVVAEGQKVVGRRRFGRVLRGVLAAAVFGLPLTVSATVEEQRARLPPPARCTDAVEGEWKALRFYRGYDDWGLFTLLIRRAAPGSSRLIGYIDTEYWDGGARQQTPPACAVGARHYLVRQDGAGSLAGLEVRFAGRNVRLVTEHCPGSFGRYNPDHFSGVIEPAIEEFQSVNNDGGRDLNEPTVFRRVRCLEPPSEPHPVVEAPHFQPPRRSRGCAR
ncbi:MAG: hypothetical protein JNK72_23200 [Myxococcales bacterium]|nr:hypothetical protein [Myxococcales bacterium]